MNDTPNETVVTAAEAEAPIPGDMLKPEPTLPTDVPPGPGEEFVGPTTSDGTPVDHSIMEQMLIDIYEFEQSVKEHGFSIKALLAIAAKNAYGITI